MSFKADLFAYLSTEPTLVALVNTRLYPERLPQEPTLPAATYLQVSGLPTYAHDGLTGFERARIQFDSYGTTPLAAEAIADALRAALLNWRLADSRYVGFEESRQDIPEPELGRYRVSSDFMINREEA